MHIPLALIKIHQSLQGPIHRIARLSLYTSQRLYVDNTRVVIHIWQQVVKLVNRLVFLGDFASPWTQAVMV